MKITVDGQEFPWAHPFHGLLSAGFREREVTLLANRGAFDCSNAEFETVLAEIATLPEPGARMDTVSTWSNTSTAVRYDDLAAKLQPGASLAREDLAPPPIERLMGGWRLSTRPSEEPFSTQLDAAARTLLADIGLAGALARLSALPIALPAPVVTALEELAATERTALLRRHAAACQSPVARFHSVWLLLRFPDADDVVEQARAHLVWLVNKGVEACRTLLGLVQAALDQFRRQRSFSQLGAAQRLAAAWLHAHEVDSRLRHAGAPEEWMGGLGRWAVHGTPEEWLCPDSDLLGDVAWPQQFTPALVQLFGLAYALSANPDRGRELFAPLRDSLVERLTVVADTGGRVAAQEIRRNITLASNAVGSFLTWRPEVVEVVGDDVAAHVTPEFHNDFLNHVVQELEHRPNDLVLWAQPLIAWGALPPPAVLADKFAVLLVRLDVRQLMSDAANAVPALEVVQFACWHKSLGHVRFDDDAARGLLINAARRLHEIGIAKLADLDHLAGGLLEACRNAAIVAGDPEASARRLAELLRGVVDAWPTLGKLCRAYVQQLSDRLPVAQAKWLWSLLTYLRSLP